MTRKVRSKKILNVEQLAEIGSIALESTECEITVESLIWALAGLEPEVGVLFTQGLQMNSRLELLSALGKARLSKDEDIERYAGIISKLKELNSRRNLVIHGSWGAWVALRDIAQNPGVPPETKAIKRTRKGVPVELYAAELKGTPESFAKATNELRAFAETAWPHM